MSSEFDVAKAVKTVVAGHFEHVAERFHKNPNSGNFAELDEAMWAHQCAANLTPEVLHKLYDMGVGHWVKFLAQHQKSKIISEAPKSSYEPRRP